MNLQELLKLVTTMLAITSTGYRLPCQGKIPVVKLLRKSKANNGRSSVLSFEAQDELCKAHLVKHHPKHNIVATFKSKESGMTFSRPELLKVLRVCVEHKALLLIPKVDRIARNIMVFSIIMHMNIPIEFAEYPSIDFHTGTIGEKSAIWRAAMEGYLEGLRISDRTRAVMPKLKRKRVKMGGRAHSKGSQKNNQLANEEAKSIKKHVLKVMKQNKNWSVPAITQEFHKLGLKTRRGTHFTERIVRGHLQRLGLWG